MRKAGIIISSLFAVLTFVGAAHAQSQPGLQRSEGVAIFKGDTVPGKCNPGDVYIQTTGVKFCDAAGTGLSTIYTSDTPQPSVAGGVDLTSTQSLTNKTVDGVTPTVLGYVDPTSSIQTQINAKAPTPLSGNATIGGNPLAAGACDTAATPTVTGAASGMVVAASPEGDPGAGSFIQAWVSAPNTVTIQVCDSIIGTPNSVKYDIRVIQ